jgi:hypothetical protein
LVESDTGWVLSEPLEQSLAEFVERFSWGEHARVSRNIGAVDIEVYAGQSQFSELVEDIERKRRSCAAG